MTRNTRFYRAIFDDHPEYEILFRSLTVSEVAVINRISNNGYKAEVAYDIAVTKSNIPDPNYLIKKTVGEQIVEQTLRVTNDEELFMVTVQTFRESVQDDFILNIIKFIGSSMNVSIDYLMNCTTEDLIELATMCETINNKRFFDFPGNKKQQPKTLNNRTENINGKSYIPETETISLAEKMKQAQKEYR